MFGRNANTRAAAALIDALAAGGVRAFCVSPGSRSAPLTLAVAARADLAAYLHVDERCAGFFALGLARSLRAPVALICTSGTAGAHYLPAVIEAAYSDIPLIVLTADRPPHLQDCGAPQTIDQRGLFGRFVRADIDLPPPSRGAETLARRAAARLLEAALGPRPGPVHGNVAFDEPLDDRDDGDVAGGLRGNGNRSRGAAAGPVEVPLDEPAIDEARSMLRANDSDLRAAAGGLTPGRGVIVAGPGTGSAVDVLRLAERLDAPVLADPLSGVRVPHPLVAWGYDAWLRGEAAGLRPEWALRLGRLPTSKFVVRWLERQRPRCVFAERHGRRDDPDGIGRIVLPGPVGETCRRLRGDAPQGTGGLAASIGRAEMAVDAVRARILADAPPDWEGVAVDTIGRLLPHGATLLLASSMPVREADGFLPPREGLDCVANRGANGIDGLVSTTFGAAASGPTWALLGDLATLHDLGGFQAATRTGLRPVFVVLNNDGGGIFSYLPSASATAADTFERWFTTPHGLDFRGAASMFGLHYETASARELGAVLAPGDRAKIVEIAVDGPRSRDFHRVFWAEAAAAAAAAVS